MYFQCICDVLTMYFVCICYVLTVLDLQLLVVCIGDVLIVYWWCIRLLCPGLCPWQSAGLSAGLKSLRKSLRRRLWGDVFNMYCQCILDVSWSWMYYDAINHVYLMYYRCIGSCTPHLCFPPYSTHHLFGAQPFRVSSFCHQQPMGLAPVGCKQPRHGSTRHAFWQTGHACSSMFCCVLSCRNYCWAGIHTGPYTPCCRPVILGCIGGGQKGPKRQLKVPAE